MKTVSTTVKNLIAQEKVPDIEIIMTWGTGGTTQMQYFVDNSIVRRRGCSEGGDFTPGACNIGSFEFAFYDDDDYFNTKMWEDAKFTVRLIYKRNNNTYPITFGTYYVGSHTKSGQVVKVLGYDGMVYLDKQTLTKEDITTAIGGTLLVGQTKWNALVDLIIADTPLIAGHIPSDIYSEEASFVHYETITKRQLLQMLLAQAGGFAFIDDDGNLTFRYYATSIHGTGAVLLDNLKKFSAEVSPVTFAGFRFVDTTGNNADTYMGDSVGYVIPIESNILYYHTSGKPYNNYNRLTNLIGVKTYYGTITVLNNPCYEPGDYGYYTEWKVGDTNTTNFFLFSQLVWRYQAVRETLQSDANPPEMQDLRIGGESEYDDTRTVFASGTITLLYASGDGYYRYLQLDGVVPAKYRQSYVVVASANGTGTLLRVVQNTNNIGFYGDTQDMVVSYTISKQTETQQQQAAVTTDYGMLAQQHLSEIQGGYTQ